MSGKRLVRLIYAVVFLTTVTAGTALAQSFDKRTFFTFGQPTAIPGVTLPAGTYLFRLADVTEHNVVQVMSEDGRLSYSTFFTFPAYRSEASENSELTFMETASGMPAAVDTWWYPTEKYGYHFLYPKEQARTLAAGLGRAVMTFNVTPSKERELVLATPSGAETKVADIPYEPGPIEVGEPAPADLPVRTELPKTGSPTAYVAFAGLAFLASAGLIKALRAGA